jgi:hypothetical protein
MHPQPSADDRWVTGDHFAIPIPAVPAALRAYGTTFLTQAFRVSGALTAGNAVTGISRFEEVPGGSTGRKLLLRIEYDKPGAQTRTDLFVKFSRDLQNPIRDRGKTQSVRAPLQMLTNALNLWETRHFGEFLDATLG